MLVCRTKPEATELDPHSFKNSNFAKWYYQNDNKHLQKHPSFTVVGKNDEALHKLSLKLAQTVDNGDNIDPELYQSFVESVNQFRTSHTHVAQRSLGLPPVHGPFNGCYDTNSHAGKTGSRTGTLPP